MSPFAAKPLTTLTVGETIGRARQEKGWSLFELAKATNITPRFLRALEEDRHSAIPGDIYLRQWLRDISRTLKLNNHDLIAQWLTERTRGYSSQLQPTVAAKTHHRFTARQLRWLGAVIAIIATLSFLGVRLYAVIAPPPLTLEQPHALTTTLTNVFSIEVRGQTTAEATVTINRQAVNTALHGDFSQIVPLHRGINTITITSRNKHGFSATLQRIVVVEVVTP
ncbi:MAG: hypothetical protein UY81_C0066G0005 [Candidatus Giovannonibacteria bacterium GW2011_GWA2_53_7]|uniref:HTH cro/C1-type domain-containing protein n=1 Tax=Candidatus Giovannonibacteria bacterium GW2011_GWA2_53_7 TaxID=1618650 RepID=A0A0G1XUL5_9BACT|nr:MAG: hypothetical protein UY81_C0066G0005 [Candidatus Giovannonibacteria bacterium GW2011_GWA2_53_7]